MQMFKASPLKKLICWVPLSLEFSPPNFFLQATPHFSWHPGGIHLGGVSFGVPIALVDSNLLAWPASGRRGKWFCAQSHCLPRPPWSQSLRAKQTLAGRGEVGEQPHKLENLLMCHRWGLRRRWHHSLLTTVWKLLLISTSGLLGFFHSAFQLSNPFTPSNEGQKL